MNPLLPTNSNGLSNGTVPRRVILLGASNLTKGIATVLETAYRAWGRPLEVLTALGHGRSYGAPSSILGRQLPGILDCGLWPILSDRAAVATAALVTDIGNDLLYEHPVDQIATWIENCLDRLVNLQARTVVTLLPVGNLVRLSKGRFQLMRTLFFPHSRLTLEEVRRRAHVLNEHVRRLRAREDARWSNSGQRGMDSIRFTSRNGNGLTRGAKSSRTGPKAPRRTRRRAEN